MPLSGYRPPVPTPEPPSETHEPVRRWQDLSVAPLESERKSVLRGFRPIRRSGAARDLAGQALGLIPLLRSDRPAFRLVRE
jgi:hypothetical protein